ncbi:MAG: hypothetical protein AAF423_00500 [Pseudomonadota bacterium]
MKEIGSWRADKAGFKIELGATELLGLGKCIYAFTDTNDNFLRIGSSKNKLHDRMKAWERDVTKAILGQRSPTPVHEAKKWMEYQAGTVWARQGTVVETSVGKFECYLDEESVLIGRHLPPLNHSKHR